MAGQRNLCKEIEEVRKLSTELWKEMEVVKNPNTEEALDILWESEQQMRKYTTLERIVLRMRAHEFGGEEMFDKLWAKLESSGLAGRTEEYLEELVRIEQRMEEEWRRRAEEEGEDIIVEWDD